MKILILINKISYNFIFDLKKSVPKSFLTSLCKMRLHIYVTIKIFYFAELLLRPTSEFNFYFTRFGAGDFFPALGSDIPTSNIHLYSGCIATSFNHPCAPVICLLKKRPLYLVKIWEFQKKCCYNSVYYYNTCILNS